MNTEWFYCFVETVHSKSLLKTSLKLNISQPAASKQIQKLEQALGVTLFKRSHSGMELTEAGREFYQRIQPILAELKALQRDLQTIECDRSIVLGTLPSLAAYYLPPRVSALKQQGVTIDIQVFNRSVEAIQNLQAGHLDAALIQTQPDLDLSQFPWSAELFQEPYFAVLPPDHPLRRHSALTMAQLRREAMITYPPGCDTRQSLMRVCQNHGFQPKVISEIAFGESILNFVSIGEGMTLVPQLIADRTHHLPVIIRPVSDFDELRTIALVTRLERIGRSLQPHL